MALELYPTCKSVSDRDHHMYQTNIVHLIFERNQCLSVKYFGLIGLQIMFNESVMVLTVHIRHESIDLLVYHLCFRIAQNTTC